MPRLYSNLKFLEHRTQIEALKRHEIVAPVHVRIKPINRCNHSCWYCAYRARALHLGEDMDLEDRIPEDKMFEIVDDLIDMGVKAVTFSGGGEPLIYKRLPEVVERLGAGGIRVASLTNGSNLKGAMADAFARWGTWIRVSLDAWDGRSYAASRGVPDDAYRKLLENMRAFRARGSACVLGVSFIVSRDNHDHIFEVCKTLKDIGVNHVKLSGAIVANDMRANNLYHQAIAAVVGEQIGKARQRLACDDFAVVDHYHEMDELFDKTYDRCPFLQFLTVIGADCAVYACQDKAYTDAGRLGSIRDQSFKSFWFSDANRERLYGLDPSTACRHHCVAHGKNLAITELLTIDPAHAAFV